MAEALFKAKAEEGIQVGSAGLGALVDVPADVEACRLMDAEGLDISGHRGRQLTPAMALATDLILVMDARQKFECEKLVPMSRGRVYLLGHWQPQDRREIPDPFRKGPAAFQSALEQIRQSVGDWLTHVVAEQRSS